MIYIYIYIYDRDRLYIGFSYMIRPFREVILLSITPAMSQREVVMSFINVYCIYIYTRMYIYCIYICLQKGQNSISSMVVP